MTDLLPLNALGDRICIIGPSNAGKSTLAVALGRKTGLPAIHLDQFYHLPNTDWVARPKAEYVALHDAAILGEKWIIEGNYQSGMPARFDRATAVIWVHSAKLGRMIRYFRRTLFQTTRAGGLDGNRDSLKWAMFSYLTFEQKTREGDYIAHLANRTFPIIEIASPSLLDGYYRHWGLTL